MKPILIFSHNYIKFNWYEIVEEQLIKLVRSDLYKNATEIYYGAYAEDEFQLFKFINLVKSFDDDQKIKIIVHPFNDGEKQTLILLRSIILQYEDAYVLYYHTKGITSLLNHTDLGDFLKYSNIESWRHCLEYFNIELWKDNIQIFETSLDVDIIGILYSEFPNTPPEYYFAGNFWWAQSSYLKQLPDLKPLDNRLDCEKWIGMGNHNWRDVYNAPEMKNLYLEYFDPKKYKKNLVK